MQPCDVLTVCAEFVSRVLNFDSPSKVHYNWLVAVYAVKTEYAVSATYIDRLCSNLLGFVSLLTVILPMAATILTAVRT